MSKRWVMVAGALLLLCAAPTAALAVAESMVTLSLGNQTPSGPFADVCKSGVMVGLNGGYRVNRWLESGVDLAYFHGRGKRDGDSFNVTEPTTGDVVNITLAESWTITELGLYGKAFVFEHRSLAPYLRAGVGTYVVRYAVDVSASSGTSTVEGNEQESKFGVNGGVGVRGRVSGGLTLGVEALYHRIFANATNVSFSRIGVSLGFGAGGK
jgi:hypothetical protein